MKIQENNNTLFANYFFNLPLEILQNIFFRLNNRELLNASLVDRTWNFSAKNTLLRKEQENFSTTFKWLRSEISLPQHLIEQFTTHINSIQNAENFHEAVEAISAMKRFAIKSLVILDNDLLDRLETKFQRIRDRFSDNLFSIVKAYKHLGLTLQLPSGKEKSRQLLTLLRKFTKLQQLATASKLLKQHIAEEDKNEAHEIIALGYAKNVKYSAAIFHLESISSPAQKGAAYLRLLEPAFLQEFQAKAQEAVLRSGDADLASQFFATTAKHLRHSDRKAAIRAAEKIDIPYIKNFTWSSLARSLQKSGDHKLAFTCAQKISNAQLKNKVLKTMISVSNSRMIPQE